MSKPVPNPRRLWQLSPEEDSSHLARIFRDARTCTESDLPRLHWRLRHTLRERAARPKRLLRLGLTVGLVFVAGGTVTAALHPYWHHAAPMQAPRSEPTQAVRERPRRPVAPVAKATVAETATPVELPAPKVAEPAAEAAHMTTLAAARRAALRWMPEPAATPPAPPPVPMPSPPLSSVAREHALLGAALKSLRHDGDPQTTLVMLDEHTRLYPDSAFRQDASMLRAEALLALGRNEEALSLMDHLAFRELPNRNERLVLRGELRAAAGRWKEARADFEPVAADLSGTATARDVRERALWGLASSRGHLGDSVGARSDLELYLRTFPRGRFAAEAAALLKGAP
jgi:hypothetical protein